MQLTIERDALLGALTAVFGAVDRRTTIPILGAVRLEAAGAGLTCTATDLDLQARAHAACEIAAPGIICAPAETLLGFVRKLKKNAPVTLALDEPAGLAVTSGRARLLAPTLPPEDFPVFSGLTAAARFSLPGAELRRLIDRTRHAISTEATRDYLNGIFLTAAGEELHAVATDGHRLALAAMNLPEGAAGLAAIVPRKAVGEIRKALAEFEGQVEIGVAGGALQIVVGDCVLASKLVDGKFPDYQRIIPRGASTHVTVNRAALAEAVARVLIVSDTDARSVRVETGVGALIVRARQADRGEASDEIAAEAPPGIEIGFNGKYLLDHLSAMQGESVTLHVADATSPARLDDDGDANALGVLMPLRV